MALVIMLIALIKIFNTQNYRITFIDNDTNDTLRSEKIKAEMLNRYESPVTCIADSNGIITVMARNGIIRMVVSAPYFIEDTITRFVRKSQPSVQVRLKPDYYALMVDYFSRTDVGSWQRRRESLDRMFSDDAIIFQMPDINELSGLELYTKNEFIDKLTMPSSALKRIEVLDCRYQGNRVSVLRFRYKID
jgi:hypothetical protein